MPLDQFLVEVQGKKREWHDAYIMPSWKSITEQFDEEADVRIPPGSEWKQIPFTNATGQTYQRMIFYERRWNIGEMRTHMLELAWSVNHAKFSTRKLRRKVALKFVKKYEKALTGNVDARWGLGGVIYKRTV